MGRYGTAYRIWSIWQKKDTRLSKCFVQKKMTHDSRDHERLFEDSPCLPHPGGSACRVSILIVMFVRIQ